MTCDQLPNRRVNAWLSGGQWGMVREQVLALALSWGGVDGAALKAWQQAGWLSGFYT
ncbi:hypothetical protein GCM10010840_33800 [Deinococcus aerolatus]|uniref:Uncharacterized protein n=1 Tax=Deinococcus aerolatus TaxID=522487 RepID=A0ABQ2GET8_9DEIO|nr:hypothetical protein GCM10010840_33800 [Deinococcus aerolatus]